MAFLVWPVSARNIRKCLGSWFLCVIGSSRRRRWSGKLAALRSALFRVESSLGALSPLGAGCWCSYTHILQQQSSAGWTAGNSLSWQNSAFWQDSWLQQPLPCPCRTSNPSRSPALAEWLPLYCCPYLCWSGTTHLVDTGWDPLCLGGTLFLLYAQHCGTFTDSKSMVIVWFEPPNFIPVICNKDSLISFPILCL